ncbi:MAG TPA: hypothetical protein VK158_05600 [Acidobacteriota bacterium]|nr:hypothetical protein [Acidobacteriota bacterium]
MIFKAFSLGRKHTQTICDAFECAYTMTYENWREGSLKCKLYESKISRHRTIEMLVNNSTCTKVGYTLGKISKPLTYLRAQAYLSGHDEPQSL